MANCVQKQIAVFLKKNLSLKLHTNRFQTSVRNIANFKSYHLRTSVNNFCNIKQSKYRDIRRQYTHDVHIASGEKISEPSFWDMISSRQKQAQATVLIELATKDDASYAAKLCKDCGDVRTFIPYTGEYGNAFLLTEFKEEASVHRLLQGCSFRNVTEVFPTYSRLIRYEKKKTWKKIPHPINEETPGGPKTKPNTSTQTCVVSQLMQKVYEEEKLTDLSIRLRFLFSYIIQDAVSGMFPYCSILPFGSSVNSFGAEGCDLDLVVQLHPEKMTTRSEFYFQAKPSGNDFRVSQQRTINGLFEILRAYLPGISHVNKILNARVPILKFEHKILDLFCDVSVNNMAAVYMAEILYFCGGLDSRVRPLIYSMKKWAKEANVTYKTPGSWVTNFSLSLLALFFLQNRPVPILPPLVKALTVSASANYLSAEIQYLEKPAKWKNMAKKNTESLGTLMMELLTFLGTFPFEDRHISVLTGIALQRKDGYPLWIQYPLEDDMNVSKNVSKTELNQMSSIAKISAAHVAKYIGQSESSRTDLMMMLGIQKMRKEDAQAINVSTLFDDSIINTKEDARIA